MRSVSKQIAKGSTASSSEFDPELALDLSHVPGVDFEVFHIFDTGKVVPCDDVNVALTDALSSEQTNGSSYWVHVDSDDLRIGALNAWIDRLNLGNNISNQIKRPTCEWLSKVVCTRSKALVMMRTLPLTSTDGKFKFGRADYLAAVVTQRMLLTYTTTAQRDIKSIYTATASVKHMTQDESLREGSSSGALLCMLEFHLQNTQDVVTSLRNESLLMVQQMDLEPQKLELNVILNLRNRALAILSIAEEQCYCLAMMKDMDVESDGADFAKIEGALGMLIQTAKSTELRGKRLVKRVDGMKDAFNSYEQERMNKRVAFLTIISAIFMPLTFFAGVYGMNFTNIPELNYKHGYYLLWGFMSFMALALIVVFCVRGWFK
jgi:Mg2+ and Co2+ transporter CorA